MKSKKVTMLAAALVVAVVAVAGIGYAATFTAQTTNTDNGLDSTYIVMSQTSASTAYGENMLKDVYFSTVNTDANETEFLPVYDVSVATVGETKTYTLNATTSATLMSASNVLTLAFEKQNFEEDTVNLVVTADGFDPIEGLTYYMVLGNTSGNSVTMVKEAPYNNGWTFSGLDISANEPSFDVYIFIGGTVDSDAENIDKIDSVGFSNTEDLATTFTFVATATVN